MAESPALDEETVYSMSSRVPGSTLMAARSGRQAVSDLTVSMRMEKLPTNAGPALDVLPDAAY